MPVSVLVVVELHDADVDQCIAFDAAITARGYVRVGKGGGAFIVTLEQEPEDEQILQTVQAAVDASAGDADILLWNGVCVIGCSTPLAPQAAPNEDFSR